MKTNLLKGILLITGTTIGGGMLAHPVITSFGGFLPSALLYILCWIFMMATGLLTAEVCFWVRKEHHHGEINFITMATKTLGMPGKWIAWILYIFLFYSLTLAYTVGCGGLLVDLAGDLISPAWGPLIFAALFVPCVYAGAKFVGKMNIFLVGGLVVSYFLFVMMGFQHVDLNNWKQIDWYASLRALPATFIAFGFHGTVPTLMKYLDWNERNVRISILWGTFIPLVVYLIWEGLIMGIVPLEGRHGLAEAFALGHSAVQPLQHFIDSPYFILLGRLLAFFALVTSFLGVSLGLVDFLSDGLDVERTARGEALLCGIIYLPVLFIAYLNPDIFIWALNDLGGLGGALLLALLPIVMAWAGRYRLHLVSNWKLPGGKPLLAFMALFVFVEMALEAYRLWTINS